MMTEPLPCTQHEDGVTTVDANYVRPGLASVHVFCCGGRAAVVDSGANSAVPLLLAALGELGIERDSVDLLFLTHVHLDHAGGAGELVRHLPNAQVLAHPRGAPHLVDPSFLQAATAAVYGDDAYAQLYGDLVPIPADRIAQTHDGQRVQLGGHELTVLHTPGHALHHHVLLDAARGAVFTGDSFGLSYRELDTSNGAFIVPTTTPTQFDPVQLIASVQRIAALDPTSVYLTHYGRVTGSQSLAESLCEQIEHYVGVAKEHAAASDRYTPIRAALRADLVQRATAHGLEEPAARVDAILGNDLDLNTQGLLAWLDRLRSRS